MHGQKKILLFNSWHQSRGVQSISAERNFFSFIGF